jgi:hypothetical protein
MNGLLPDLPPIQDEGQAGKKQRGRKVTAEKQQKEDKQKPAGERPGVCECGSGGFQSKIEQSKWIRTCKKCGDKKVV